MKIGRFCGALLICLPFIVLTACSRMTANSTSIQQLDLKAAYHVVFLSNSNAYIGKIRPVGTDYFYLTDVYYIQSQVNPDTKQVSNTLVKRGQELHKPDSMYVNAQHVLMIEPVTPGSQVANLIQQAEGKK